MTDSTQPRMARGTFTAAAALTALVALLAFAPFASAASDPVASGTTTVTLNGGFTKSLKKFGIKLTKLSPAKLKGKKATFTVTGGLLDPTTGLGTVNLGGGLQFKAGSKKAPIKSLVLDTSKKSLTAKVAGKKMKMASVAGFSFARNGFGVNLTVKKLKLTGSAAKQLNKKLGYTGKKKAKKHKRASASKAQGLPFKANQVLGGSTSETQPSTVTVLPGGTMLLATAEATIKKLADVEVKIPVTPPTTEPSKGVFGFPITGGTVGPSGTAGVVQSVGGLQLLQKLQTGPTTFLETEITLGNFYVDLAAKTLSVEVIAKSNASKELNLGNLGRASIADLTVTGVTANPVTHTVSVQGNAVLQPVAAEVLEGFVKVYQAYLTAVFQGPPFLLTEEQAKAKAAEEVAADHITAGTPLGTISFTAQTQ